MKWILWTVAGTGLLLATAFVICALTHAESQIRTQITINRPSGEVFAWLTGPEKLPLWIEGVTSCEPLTSGGTRPGAKARVTIHEGKRTMIMESEVQEVIANQKLVTRLSVTDGPAMMVLATYQLHSQAWGTELELVQRVSYQSFWLKGLAPLIDRVSHKKIDGDLARLKAALEAPQETPPGHQS